MAVGLTWVDAALEAIERAGRRRRLRPVHVVSATEVLVDGRRVRLFSSNDYLGLSQHPAVRDAAREAAAAVGMGPRAATLICGYTDQHELLESELAALKDTEAALLFPTGYAANLGVLSALGSPDTVFFSDELNHASIIDGCRLARSKVIVYRHRDVDHLADLLDANPARRRVVVTDSVFSMEGDLAPLVEIVALRERHEFALVVDEAHATGVFGPRGGGLVQLLGVGYGVDFQVATLSKALGTHGGVVCCSSRLRDWLLNTARPYIFTTALPMPVVAAAVAAIQTAATGELRERLWERVGELAAALGRELGAPIAPIIVGEEKAAVTRSQKLLEQGFHVTAIRPPTVPAKGSRLRVTVSAAHTAENVAELGIALRGLI
jgi:8-amino-7-oxononanoate synthase